MIEVLGEKEAFCTFRWKVSMKKAMIVGKGSTTATHLEIWFHFNVLSAWARAEVARDIGTKPVLEGSLAAS